MCVCVYERKRYREKESSHLLFGKYSAFLEYIDLPFKNNYKPFIFQNSRYFYVQNLFDFRMA